MASCNPLLTDLTTSANSDIDSAEVESENDTIVDTGIEVVKGIGTGLYDSGKDFVVGLWDTITNPKATLDGLVNAVTNPVETYNTIKTAICESYDRDMVNGDANSRAHWVTYAIGTVATSIIGTKGTTAIVKTGTTAVKAAAPTIVATTKRASSSLVNLLPYTPRPQLAMAGEIPYNVVNSAGYKDQLLNMAEVESGFKGTGYSGKVVSGAEWSKIKTYSADEANKWWKDNMGYENSPYKPGTIVSEVKLSKNTKFVRVYDGDVSGQFGGWLMKAEDIAELTHQQIRDKFALPAVPKYITDVNVPADTVLRTGIVNPLEGWGAGGGVQFDLMGKRIGEFTNPRLLP